MTRGASLLRYGLILTVPALLAVSVLSASTASAATTRARPGEPRHVTAVAGNNSAIVRFLPPSFNGGYRVNRYDILTETTGTKQVYTCTATDCRVGGLTAGTLYFFQVAAVTKVGRGAYSLPSKVVTVTGSISITFNANGGTGKMAPETEPYDATAALTPNAFTYVGYMFAGWNTKANGSGTTFTDSALAKFNGNATLYAQWTVGSATTATVTFNANGGTGSMAPETETLDVSTAVTTNAFTRTGYTFSGWNTAPNGSGTSYAGDAVYSFGASITLYAQWTVVATAQFTNTSLNWSGYVIPSSSAFVTSVKGEWTVPTLNCTDTPDSDVAVWVGTGGVGSNTGALLQTGVTSDCANGVQQNFGWWYIDPSSSAGELNFSNFPVSPGNEIEASVFETSDGAWATEVTDLNTGLTGYLITGESWGVGMTSASTFSQQGNAEGVSYSGGYTAEWIVEDPENSTIQAEFPFANFGSVTFSNMVSSFSSWSLTPTEEWGIVQNGVTLAAPTNTTSDGFTVSYTGS